MDTGFDSVKLVVIVLVVLAQGVSSFMKWLKKKRAEALQKEAALGLPTNREEPQAKDEEPGIDWDTWGQEEETPVPQAPTPPQDLPAQVSSEPIAAPAAMEPAPSPSDPAPSASMHRVIAAHAARPGAGRLTTTGARPSLRSMMLGKIVLDRPVSARHGSARAPRD